MNPPTLLPAQLSQPQPSHPSLAQLRWLLLSLFLVAAMFAVELAFWVPLLALALGAWRYALAAGNRPLPGMKLLLPIVVLGSLGILASYKGIFGRDAGVALLTLMTALKTLEMRSRRDMTLVVYLAFFLCVCAFLFTQSMLVAGFMPVPVAMLVACLVGLSHPNGELPARRKLGLAGLMLAQAVPLMLVLFLLFPRVPGPLWGIPQDMARGQTGLSEDMSPGSISELSQSGAVAFRAVFKGAVPASARLYWRGPVLWHYDGRTWRPGRPPQVITATSLTPRSAPVEYTVTLEAHNKPWLFVLDLPQRLPAIGALTSDYQFLARRPVRQRVRYDAASVLDYREGLALDADSRARALQLPRFGNPRARALAAQWLAETRDPAQLVSRALAMFNADFRYTLTPPLLDASPVDGFLFDTRQGFCEHYAGSFVFLMRLAGVPARVVTGYQGGQPNPMGDYLIVRQSDAHAWAEVWLEGRGWVRVDPTAAVAPERVERGIAAAVPELELPEAARSGLDWLQRMRLGWDAVNNGWNQWVLGYNQQRQLELLARLTRSQVDWRDLTLWLTGTLALVVGAVAAILLRDRLPADPVLRQWQRFRNRLARAGVPPQPTEGPRDYAARAARALPAHAQAIERIAALYIGLRYGGGGDPAELHQRVKAFRPR